MLIHTGTGFIIPALSPSTFRLVKHVLAPILTWIKRQELEHYSWFLGTDKKYSGSIPGPPANIIGLQHCGLICTLQVYMKWYRKTSTGTVPESVRSNRYGSLNRLVDSNVNYCSPNVLGFPLTTGTESPCPASPAPSPRLLLTVRGPNLPGVQDVEVKYSLSRTLPKLVLPTSNKASKTNCFQSHIFSMRVFRIHIHCSSQGCG
jgi:hypothetical protein